MKDGPLREGLILLAGLGLLAWPLSLVTGSPGKVASQALLVDTRGAEDSWVTDVEVRSAHPFQWVELRRGDEVLGRLEGPNREGEFECLLPNHGDLLTVEAQYPEGTPETALEVQLWPGSLPELKFTLWGEGRLLEQVEAKFHE